MPTTSNSTPVKPARTCIRIKPDGVKCGSLALRNSPLCYHHHGHRRELKRHRIRETLRTPEGRVNAVELLFHSVMNKHVDPQTARAMLHAIMVGTRIDS